ncbi:class I SAM-dependent RNA methyltransferase [bacterium]|nr:class I SAM-dependent RNA methyltransferase [bacterium]NBX97857.1 class I SAM-dependent RNA methyltransferase [bacterium]NDC94290.1 class I SAM-dependent RNA methyltransferase [bacterium]NDD84910.1 class I SAM-dependent RNA methyltransferase [bacterium]NDG28701.1 class I SAM-dependent RNA methyltransferase [bacterium]
MEQVTIEKLVHGGQGLATLADGRKVFVWNALPGETVSLRMLKSKKGFAEAIAEEIIEPSKERIAPKEPASYLATSPWQIMGFESENTFKKDILAETFEREKITLPEFNFVGGDTSEAYRSKMEFGFWGDSEGISLAHFVRGSHGKTKVVGSMLAKPSINTAVADIVAQLNTLTSGKKAIRAGDIKSIILRTAQNGDTVAALFVKPKRFPTLTIPASLKGLLVFHSNPKSPASVPTELLQREGDRTLTDLVLGTELMYDVLSFFQVNLPVFESAVKQIDAHIGDIPKIDLYSGVGSIGIPIGNTKTLVELDAANIDMATVNVGNKPIEVVHASSDKSLDYITGKEAVIVDPPRAGLGAYVTNRLIQAKPPVIAYLSCNPSTQARDIKLLQEAGYKITFFEGYNFFPRTPHIESLAVLKLK